MAQFEKDSSLPYVGLFKDCQFKSDDDMVQR